MAQHTLNMIGEESLEEFFTSTLAFPTSTANKAISQCKKVDIYSVETLLSCSTEDIEHIGFSIGVKQKVLQNLRINISLEDLLENIKKLESYSSAFTFIHLEKTMILSKIEQEISQTEKHLIDLKHQLNDTQSSIKQFHELHQNVNNILALKNFPGKLIANSNKLLDIIKLIEITFPAQILFPMSTSQNNINNNSNHDNNIINNTNHHHHNNNNNGVISHHKNHHKNNNINNDLADKSHQVTQQTRSPVDFPISSRIVVSTLPQPLPRGETNHSNPGTPTNSLTHSFQNASITTSPDQFKINLAQTLPLPINNNIIHESQLRKNSSDNIIITSSRKKVIVTMTINSGIYQGSNAENTYESLTDGNYLTGICVKTPARVTFSFSSPQKISVIKFAAFFKDSQVWYPYHGVHCRILYLPLESNHNNHANNFDQLIKDSPNDNWVEVGEILDTFGKKHEIHSIQFTSAKAIAVRFEHHSYLGLSHFSYE